MAVKSMRGKAKPTKKKIDEEKILNEFEFLGKIYKVADLNNDFTARQMNILQDKIMTKEFHKAILNTENEMNFPVEYTIKFLALIYRVEGEKLTEKSWNEKVELFWDLPYGIMNSTAESVKSFFTGTKE